MSSLFFCIAIETNTFFIRHRPVPVRQTDKCSGKTSLFCDSANKHDLLTRYRHAESGDKMTAGGIQGRKSPFPYTGPFYPFPCPETASARLSADNASVPLPFSVR